jgi:hypothetical protein
MKSIARHAAGVLALAFVLLETVPAGGDPETGRNEGCLGETFRVAIDSHVHTNTRINGVSEISPTGTKVIGDYDLTLRGTYVRELHDGKTRWVSRTIDWSGQSSGVVFGCYSNASEAGGHLELGPTDGPVDTISREQRDQIKWNVKPEKNLGGSCFLFGGGGGGAPLRVPEIRGTRDTLRSGHYYMAVDRDGSRYSETVEQRGNEKVSISAEPTEIVPNQSLKNTDEATSQLTIRATCDGAPLKDRQIGLRIDVKPRSGYHNHVLNRPRGKFAVGDTETDCGFETGALPETLDDTSCTTVTTDANGEAKVKFKSPLTGSVDPTEKGAGPYRSGIAGDYKITAKDSEFTEVRDSTEILAKVKDLKPATFDSNLEELRGGTSAHPDGSYGAEGTLNAFAKLAKAFHDYQILHNIALTGEYCKKTAWLPVVSASTNDIALPEGGIFDWNTTKTPWRPSHQTHNKGGGGDFNRFGDYENKNRTECGGTTANLQVWYMQVFIELGKDYGQWDCSDLGASGGYPMFSPHACAVGEIPTGEVIAPFVGPQGPAVFYFPPRLHLHVED